MRRKRRFWRLPLGSPPSLLPPPPPLPPPGPPGPPSPPLPPPPPPPLFPPPPPADRVGAFPLLAPPPTRRCSAGRSSAARRAHGRDLSIHWANCAVLTPDNPAVPVLVGCLELPTLLPPFTSTLLHLLLFIPPFSGPETSGQPSFTPSITRSGETSDGWSTEGMVGQLRNSSGSLEVSNDRRRGFPRRGRD